MKTCLAALALLIVVTSVIPDEAGAIPAFARRHKISCTTCHAPFPRLKDYGEEFAGNGFTIPEDEKERDYVKTGDDLLKLNKDFPLAGRFDAYGVWDDAKDTEYDMQSPWGLKLLSGGALAPKTGYYFYFYMSERGEVAGIEDAIIHFDDVFESGVDVAVGQFQTSDPLMKRELRLTFEDYMLYKTKIGGSNTNLTYDRGVMISYGVEKTASDFVLTVTNGNGKSEADEARQFDDNNFKNVGMRWAQGVGENLSVGFFGYIGRDDAVFFEDAPHQLLYIPDPVENDITYWGPDMGLSFGDFTLTGQYLLRTDDNPNLASGLMEVETKSTIAELVYGPGGDLSKHWFTALYNKIDSDVDMYDYETMTLGATYTMARNLRLMVEYTRDLEHETNRVVMGTVTAF